MGVNEPDNDGTFEELGVSEPLVRALHDVGYETPTAIQRRTIPVLLSGRDVIGQAPTGTGKTAAFSLPILQKLDPVSRAVQALVLTPTRELAIQVAEALHTYARWLEPVRVLPVYGGQPIQQQLARLRSGVQVVVGTPGRIMDHLRRGSLDLSALTTIVLDEADEMLRMGFLEDVEWILAQCPSDCQTALFSATILEEVRRIADRYLQDPATIDSRHMMVTVPTIEQRFIPLAEGQKLDTLTQLLELQGEGEACLIFVRTKLRAAELAERLQARGYAAEAMQGDMSQAQRESVIGRLRSGQLELVVATDVAARGLDVERIGLVVNYDIPYDPESYVHRIGRTARAGRAGTAVLFVTGREQRMRREIEQFIGRPIEHMALPTQADIAARRIRVFKDQVLSVLQSEDLDLYLSLVQDLAEESGHDLAEIAAGAAWLARRDRPLLAAVEEAPLASTAEDGMVRLLIDAGRSSGVRPSDIVGAIANEAGIPGRAIGAIDIYDDYTLVDVPAQYQQQVLGAMAGTRLRNQSVTIRMASPGAGNARPGRTGARHPPRGAKPAIARGRTGGRASPARPPGRRQRPR
jgi:ATP-dependent RNA helicase DeaD